MIAFMQRTVALHFLINLIIFYKLYHNSICEVNAKIKWRGEIHLAFAMYRSQYAVFRQKFFFKNRPNAQYL